MALILKLCGAVCVLATSAYFGVCYGKTLDDRNIELRKLYSMFIQLKSEMRYLGTTLPECFRNLSKDNELGFWCDYLAGELDGQLGKDFCRIWTESLQVLYENSALSREDIRLLSELSDKLSGADIEGLTKSVDYLLLQIERNRLHLEEESRQKKKVAATISVFVGLMTVIVLI